MKLEIENFRDAVPDLTAEQSRIPKPSGKPQAASLL